MIPKVIHYCWLSDDPIPRDLQRYMATWKKKLPDYEFVLWDRNRFDVASVPWVKEAFESKKYAFAADYIRQYAVYTMGGIYMDMDVEVVKSFDDLLNRPYMLGVETGFDIEAGVFGAEKGCEIMKWCLDFYESHHFLKDDGSFNIAGAPKVFRKCILDHKKLEVSEKCSVDENVISVLPFDYLTAKSADTGVVKKTRNTCTVHHFAGSWLQPSLVARVKRKMKICVSLFFGERLSRWLSKTLIH